MDNLMKILDKDVLIFVLQLIVSVLVYVVRTREQGFWIERPKKMDTFSTILFLFYEILAGIFLISLLGFLCVELWYSNIWGYIIFGSFYVVASVIWMKKLLKHELVCEEISKDKKRAKRKIYSLYISYLISLLLATIESLFTLSYVVFFVLNVFWGYFFIKEYDIAYIIEHEYVDIEVKGEKIIEKIFVKSLKKRKGWISGNQGDNENNRVVFMKESEITKVFYYGNSIRTKETIRPFQRNKNFV